MKSLPFIASIAFGLGLILVSARPAAANTVVGGAITANTTWTLANSPYEVTSEIVVYNMARLTVQAGVTVLFRPGTGLIIGYYNYDHGTINYTEAGGLTVNGTSAQPVVFTSFSGAWGGWKGLAFGAATDYGGWASSLNYLTVEKAGQAQTMGGTVGPISADIIMFGTGSGFTFDHVNANTSSGYGWYIATSLVPAPATGCGASGCGSAGIYATLSTLNLTSGTVASNNGTGLVLYNSGGILSGLTISGNGGYGIDLVNTASPTITGNSISTSGQYAIRCPIAATATVTGNTLTGNSQPGIELPGGLLTANRSLSAQIGEASYTVTGSEIVVYNLARLTVGAGVTVRFATGTGLIIGYYAYDHGAVNYAETGGLTVNGTAAQPVVFTSLSGAAGGWKGLAFGPATDWGGWASSLNYLTVEKAGEAQTLGGTASPTSGGILLIGTGNGFTLNHVEANASSGYGWYIMASTVATPATACGASANASNGIYATLSTLNINGGTVGSNAATGLLLSNTGGSLSGMAISGNAGYGIDLANGSSPTIAGNTISASGQYAIRFSISAGPSITGNTLTGNTGPGIEVVGGLITGNRSLNAQSGEAIYTVTSPEIVVYNAARLTVDAGVTVRFAANTGLIIGYYNYDYGAINFAESGGLSVNGTSAQPVVFTALSGSSGGWKGLAFGAATDYGGWASSLHYLRVEKAGQDQTLSGTVGSTRADIMLFGTGNGFAFDHVEANSSSGCGWYLSGSVLPAPASGFGASGNALHGLSAISSTVNLTGGTAASNLGSGLSLDGTGGSVSGMTISGNTSYGIHLLGASAPTIAGNAISASGTFAIRYPIAAAPTITGNTLAENTSPGILVLGGLLTANHTWSLQSGEPDFTVASEIVVHNLATLTLAAGVQAHFASNAGLVIGYYNYDYGALNFAERGRLLVDGTYDQPVLCNAWSGVSGDWKGIAFGSASDYGGLLSTIRHAIIDQAGQSQNMGGTVAPTSAGLILFGTTVALQNSVVAHSSGVGISSSLSAPDVKNTIVAYNAASALRADGGSPSFTYGDEYGNGAADVGWIAGPGCLQADPLFADQTAGLYGLLPASPCVDAGTLITGQPYLGGGPDMGAFEYGSIADVPDSPIPPAPGLPSLSGPDALRFEPLGSPGPRIGLLLGLPADVVATIEVIDINGRRLATLQNGPLSAGWHRFPVSPGVAGCGVLFARAQLRDGRREIVKTVRLVRVR